MHDHLKPLRVGVVEDRPGTAEWLREALPILGHTLLFVAAPTDLAARCREAPPDLLLVDADAGDGPGGVEAAGEWCRQRSLPVVVVADQGTPRLARRAADQRALAYLVKPVRPDGLGAALALAAFWSGELGALRQRLEDLALEEKAKAAIMRLSGVDEEEAGRRLRRLVEERKLSLAEAARAVLTADDAIRGPQRPDNSRGKAGGKGKRNNAHDA
jgi:AmiR/NasT family two-component response regulator